MIIAIDGPAGSGKSTVSKALAKRLNFIYVDTGAIYRAVTLKVLQNGLSLDDDVGICRLVDDVHIEFKESNGKLTVLLDEGDVTEEIRSSEVTNNVSLISNKAFVREKLINLQKSCASDEGSVVEGRDIGTVIFPEAEKKFFLDADLDVRAKRRYIEIKDKNNSAELEKVQNDINRRDSMDSSRKVAPLIKADDAINVDTTNLTIDEVVDFIFNEIKQ